VNIRIARSLHVGGTIVTLLALAWAHATHWAPESYGVTSTSRFWWTMVLGGLLLVTSYGIGLPELPRTRKVALMSALTAYALSIIGVSLAQLALGQALMPRFVMFGAAILIVPWYVLCAGLLIDSRANVLPRDRVIVVGDWADAASLSQELAVGAERPAQIIDVLTPDEAAATPGGELPLRDLVEAGDATVVVLDRVAQLDRTIVEQVATLHERGLRVRTLSLFYEEWLGKLPVSELERISLMFDIGEVHRLRYGRFKRVVDVAIAGVGLVPLALALPFVVAGNIAGNRGPLFFRQERVGKNGEPITMLKFRTMRDAPSGGGTWTEAGDPRVTPFGGFLRRTHVDELPQMWNILRGDLSVVGPRPEQPKYVAELSEKLPFYNLRHLVRPGLTGWAQVKYGYAASDADALEKLQYEFYYLRHQRLSLDLRIVARTLRHVVHGGGR
jgi:lipopolysaccharide/colanic/teichoic acid biosynthesis glycosyltransferase